MRLPKANCLLLLSLCFFLLLLPSGCGRQVIYQTATEPVRLAESVKAKVYVQTDKGVWEKSSNQIQLPEGWYVLPPPTPATQP